MANKQSYVCGIRPARGNEANADGVKKFDITAPIYSTSILDELNASDKKPDTVRKIMQAHKPKNIIHREKPVIEGFATISQLFAETDSKVEYTDVTGVQVTVLAVKDANVGLFQATIERQNGLTVFVKVGDTYIACPTQRDCWFFN